MSGFLTCPQGHGDFLGDRCPTCAAVVQTCDEFAEDTQPDATVLADVDAFETLAPDMDALINSWCDRGVSQRAIWSMMLTVVMTMAEFHEVSLKTVQETIQAMWENAERTRGN